MSKMHRQIQSKRLLSTITKSIYMIEFFIDKLIINDKNIFKE